MFEKHKLASAQAAGPVLERFDKFLTAIATEVAALPAKLQKRLDLERQVALAAADELTSEVGANGAAGRTRKQFQGVVEDIARASERLAGFRATLAGLVNELTERHAALAAELPGHYREIEEAFRKEWAETVPRFSLLLTKKRLVEQLIGHELNLAEPSAAVPSVQLDPDVRIPAERLQALEGAIGRISDMRSAKRKGAHAAANPLRGSYDPSKIYCLASDLKGLPQGTLVVDASFDSGLLEALVCNGQARPAGDVELERQTVAAAKLKRRLERPEENRQPMPRPNPTVTVADTLTEQPRKEPAPKALQWDRQPPVRITYSQDPAGGPSVTPTDEDWEQAG